MNSLIKLQSKIKGHYFSKNYKKNINNQNTEEPLTYKRTKEIRKISIFL